MPGSSDEGRKARALAEGVDARLRTAAPPVDGAAGTAPAVGAEAPDRLAGAAGGDEEVPLPELLGMANLVRDGLRERVVDDLARRRLRREIVAAAQAALERKGIRPAAPRRMRRWMVAGAMVAAAAACVALMVGGLFIVGQGKETSPAGVRVIMAAATPRWPAPPVPRGLIDPAEKPEERLAAKMSWGLSALREAEFQALRRKYLELGRAKGPVPASAVAMRSR